uniref:phycytochrome bilisome rod-core linker protein n=1 Tax=Rhodaphanes brevistipitata TaxID=446136 RepID=UPI001FCDFE3A|nr:phycytochrome bilisome rod-core linker protein [Rhodaphanes brevistipitata]UNJ18556.1 phycytochrome bilisome rod-core linker protein [Rhodaphanes brevistipitata]
MSIPLLSYSLSTQNQRVVGYETCAGDEQYKIYSTDSLPDTSEMDEIIWAAYRQIFSEHQILKSTRQTFLESQLRFNQIVVKDFIKELVLSDTFRKLNYDVNNNYRFVEMCVQRVLGRDIYNERERLAWSIVVADQGIETFVTMLVDSDEYMENFGDSTIPYQRRRYLFSRSTGEMPFNLKTPRYGEEFRGKLCKPQFIWQGVIRSFKPQETKVKAGDPSLFLNMVREVGPMNI